MNKTGFCVPLGSFCASLIVVGHYMSLQYTSVYYSIDYHCTSFCFSWFFMVFQQTPDPAGSSDSRCRPRSWTGRPKQRHCQMKPTLTYSQWNYMKLQYILAMSFSKAPGPLQSVVLRFPQVCVVRNAFLPGWLISCWRGPCHTAKQELKLKIFNDFHPLGLENE